MRKRQLFIGLYKKRKENLNMKKNGFTLAEVLITLAIIGVVATLTLPALLTNTGEQQAMTAYKKIVNSLNEAGQMNAALNGFDYSSVSKGAAITDKVEDGKQTLTSLFNARLQVEPSTSGDATIGGDACTGNINVVLRDGTGICFGKDDEPAATGRYIKIWVDTNGVKGPNKKATCGEEGCTTKSSRAIYDQYPVTLYGGMAIPGHWSAFETPGTAGNDYAARYAMGIDKKKAAS